MRGAPVLHRRTSADGLRFGPASARNRPWQKDAIGPFPDPGALVNGSAAMPWRFLPRDCRNDIDRAPWGGDRFCGPGRSDQI